MAIVFIAWKRNPWTVNWKHSWTGRKVSKGFATEAEAQNFATIQEELSAKEKSILKKAKKTKARISRISVRELLDSYFSLAHNNLTTISTARYHACIDPPLVSRRFEQASTNAVMYSACQVIFSAAMMKSALLETNQFLGLDGLCSISGFPGASSTVCSSCLGALVRVRNMFFMDVSKTA